MKQAFKTIFSEQDFRRIIREEVHAVLSGADKQIASIGEEGYIDINQVAELLKVSKSHLYKYTMNATDAIRIPFTKVGKRLLFKKSEVLAWADKRMTVSDEQRIEVEKARVQIADLKKKIRMLEEQRDATKDLVEQSEINRRITDLSNSIGRLNQMIEIAGNPCV